MSFADWKDKRSGFRRMDVRGVAGNFFPGLKKQAMELPVGAGLGARGGAPRRGACAATGGASSSCAFPMVASASFGHGHDSTGVMAPGP